MISNKWPRIGCIAIGLLLTACAPKPPQSPIAMQQIQTVLTNSIIANHRVAYRPTAKVVQHVSKDALLSPLRVNFANIPAAEKHHHFDVVVNNMPAREFFMGLVAGTKYNMIVDPKATDKITLNLKNVTIEQTLDAVRELYGYEYQRTSYGYEILSPRMRTQVFSIDYLNIDRKGESRTQLAPSEITNNNNGYGTGYGGGYGGYSGGNPYGGNVGTNAIQAGSTVTTKSNNNFWDGLKTTLTTLVSGISGQWVVVNPQASVIMVHAYPKSLHDVSKYLDTIEGHLNRQVTIEAKILEVQLNDQYRAGIDWRILSTFQDGAQDQSALGDNFNGGIFSLVINGPGRGDFATLIELLEQQGNLQVLSSPRISTVNNQEAVIKVGNDEFFVTGYTSNFLPTGTTSGLAQNIALNPFFSGITLDVTPEVSDNGDVTLYIHPSISTVKDQQKTIQLANTTTGNAANLQLPLAYSTIRESDDVVHAKNGQIIVIGGLMQTLTQEQIAATPWLSKLPFMGALGRNTNQLSNKVELVILLKPIFSTDRNWNRQLHASQRRFNQLTRGFHFGSRPNIFGTEGERHP